MNHALGKAIYLARALCYTPGSKQVKGVTDTVRQDRRAHASSMVATKVIGLSGLHHPVVQSKASGKNSGVGSLDISQGHTGVLQTLIYNFQQLPLLGVHVSGFHIVDTEKAVLELAKIFVNKVAAVLI